MERARTAASKRAPRELIRVGDLGLILKLPLATLITLLPPQRWDGVAGALEGWANRLGIRAVQTDTEKIRRLIGAQNIALPAVDIRTGFQRNLRLNALHFLASWRPRGLPAEIALSGTGHLQATLEAGRGAILWMAPLVFAPLIAKRALHEAGFQIHHLSRTGHGFSTTRFGRAVLNPIRTRIEDRYLAERIKIPADGSTTVAVRALNLRLAANRIVSITLNAQGARRMAVPLLAGRMQVALGAPHLALRSGAALLPVFAVRTGAATFAVEVAPPLRVPARRPRDEQIRAMIEAMAEQLQERVRLWPDQFLWNATNVEADPPPDDGPAAPEAGR